MAVAAEIHMIDRRRKNPVRRVFQLNNVSALDTF
jgi:hypothetical protein